MNADEPPVYVDYVIYIVFCYTRLKWAKPTIIHVNKINKPNVYQCFILYEYK